MQNRYNTSYFGGWVCVFLTASPMSAAANASVQTPIIIKRALPQPAPLLQALSPVHKLSLSPQKDDVQPTSLQQDLELIFHAFAPSVSSLADLFGVSRQTIYNWQKGGEAEVQNLERVHTLAQAALDLRERGIAIDPRHLSRKLFNGKNFFQRLRDWDTTPTQLLLTMNTQLQDEAKQRAALSQWLGNGKGNSMDADLPAAGNRA